MNIYLENGVWIKVVDNREGKWDPTAEKSILNEATKYELYQHPVANHSGPDVGLYKINAEFPPVIGNYLYEAIKLKIKTDVRSYGSPISRVEGIIEELD